MWAMLIAGLWSEVSDTFSHNPSCLRKHEDGGLSFLGTWHCSMENGMHRLKGSCRLESDEVTRKVWGKHNEGPEAAGYAATKRCRPPTRSWIPTHGPTCAASAYLDAASTSANCPVTTVQWQIQACSTLYAAARSHTRLQQSGLLVTVREGRGGIVGLRC